MVAHPSYEGVAVTLQPINFGAAGEREGIPGEGCQIAKSARSKLFSSVVVLNDDVCLLSHFGLRI